MPAFHLHVKNVPRQAGTLDIRRFFHPLDIPDGGVQIVGGRDGHTFITFSSNDDLVKAALYNKSSLLGKQVEVRLVNSDDIRQVVEDVKDETQIRRSSTTDVLGLFQMSQGRPPSAASGSPAQSSQHPSELLPGQRHRHGTAPFPVPEVDEMKYEQPKQRSPLDILALFHGKQPSAAYGRALRPSDSSGEYDTGRGKRVWQTEHEQYEGSKRLRSDNSEVLNQRIGEVEQHRPAQCSALDVLALFQGKRPAAASRATAQTREASPETSSRKSHKRATSPEWSPDYSRTYDRGKSKRMQESDKYKEAKRPRLSGKPPYKGSQSDDCFIVDRDETVQEDRLAVELDKELRDAQEIVNRLKEKKEKIIKLKNVIKDKDLVEKRSHHDEKYDRGRHRHQDHSESYDRRRYPSSNSDRRGYSPHYKSRRSESPESKDKHRYQRGSEKYETSRQSRSTEKREKPRHSSSTDSKSRRHHSSEDYDKHRHSSHRRDYDKYDRHSKSDKSRDPKPDDKKSTDSGRTEKDKKQRNPERTDKDDKQRSKASIEKNVKDDTAKSVQSKQTEGSSSEDAKYPGGACKDTDQTATAELIEIDTVQALFFTSLTGLSGRDTASSLWKKFGGRRGQSVGVLLLREEFEQLAYVAYEDPEARDSDCKKHKKVAKPASNTSVYTKVANAARNTVILKTTPTGEDVKLTGHEKALIKEEFLSTVKSDQGGSKTAVNQLNVFNKISRMLFAPKCTEENVSTTCEKTRNVSDGPEEAKSVQTKLTESTTPKIDNIQALLFISLANLSEGETAASVWRKFGGPKGQSVGVLLLRQKILEAYVAYEKAEARDAECTKHQGAKPASNTSVYEAFAKAPDTSVMLKTTLTGKDVKLSADEKALIRQEILSNAKLDNYGRKTGVGQLAALNNISRTLFVARSAEETVTVCQDVPNVSPGGPEHTKSNKTKPTAPKIDGPKQVETVQTKPTEPTAPKIDNIQALFFISLANLSKGETASSVWRKFGGPQGESVGVLLLWQKTFQVAYVAYEKPEPRDADCKKHEGAKPASNSSVYEVFANAIGNALMLKTTPTGDVKLSDTEKSLIRQEIIVNAELENYGRKTGVGQLDALNTISRTLFSLKCTEGSSAVCKVSTDAQSVGPKHGNSDQIKPTEPTAPKNDNVQALFFISLVNLPKSETASSVWKEFGGPQGKSVGVLLLREKTGEAYVAYEKPEDRDAEFENHEGAKRASNTSVYSAFANAPDDSVMLKTTPTGEDVKLSFKEKSLIKKAILLDAKSDKYGRKSGVVQLDALNTISRTLFSLKCTEGSLGVYKGSANQIQPTKPTAPKNDNIQALFFISLLNLSKSETASSVWQRFGGPPGQSVGVLMLKHKTGEAYVAYEKAEERDAEFENHEGAKRASNTSVYSAFANAPDDSVMLKTTPTGEDVKLSFKEKFLIKNTIPSNPKSDNYGRKTGVIQLDALNTISRTLFPLKEGSLGVCKGSTDLIKPTEPAAPKNDNVQAVFFISLGNLSEGETASSVWRKFGGPQGQSVGVLLLRHKTGEAYVAYEKPEERDAEFENHEGAKRASNTSVYSAFAYAPVNSVMLKTTTTGEDVPLSAIDKVLIKQEFLWKEKSDNYGNGQLHALNSISRSLFALKSSEESEIMCEDTPNVSSSGPEHSTSEKTKLSELTDSKAKLTGSKAKLPDSKAKSTDPKAKSTDSKAKSTDSKAKSTDSKAKSTDPKAKVTDPKANSTDPKANLTDPGTDVEPALYFIAERLPPWEKASRVWERYGGAQGQSVGVLLLRSKVRATAFVAYEKGASCKAELKRHKGATSASSLFVYRVFAKANEKFEKFKTTPAGEDVALSNHENSLIKEIPSKDISKTVRFLNTISRTLFALEVWYLHLYQVPAASTACQVSKWFGGCTGPQPHVIMTENTKMKDQAFRKAAFVRISGIRRSKLGKERYKQSSRDMDVNTAFGHISKACQNPSFNVYKSTDTGMDVALSAKERQTFHIDWFPEEELTDAGTPCILQIKALSINETASNVWSWFGSEKGPAQGVMLMNEGQTRVAFVKFYHPERCKEEKVKHQVSEIISTTEMLNRLALPSCIVIISSMIGDCSLPAHQRRFVLAKKQSLWEINYRNKLRKNLSKPGKDLLKKREERKQESHNTNMERETSYQQKLSQHTNKPENPGKKKVPDIQKTENLKTAASKEETQEVVQPEDELKGISTSAHRKSQEAVQPEEQPKGTSPSTHSISKEAVQQEEQKGTSTSADSKPMYNIKHLHFLCLRRLHKKTTAFSVWQQFGGSAGNSIGVILLDERQRLGLTMEYVGEVMAFVAYRDQYQVQADRRLHEGTAEHWVCKKVYERLAESQFHSKVLKTTPSGYVKISERESEMLKEEFLLKPDNLCTETKQYQDIVLNKISNSFFGISDLGVMIPEAEGNMPDSSDVNIADPSDVNIADPLDSNIADPSDSNIADPSDVNIADPSDADIADPSDVDHSDANNADPSDSNIADPSDVNIADPSDADVADPSDVDHSDANNADSSDSNIADPSDVNIADPSDADIADPSDVDHSDANNADPSDVNMADSSDVHIAPSDGHIVHPSEVNIANPSDANIAEPSVNIANPSDVDHSDANNADTSGVNMADPSDGNVAEPSDVDIADPSDGKMADPTDANIADLSDADIADPSDVNINNPSDADIADPSDENIADPSVGNIADPSDSV